MTQNFKMIIPEQLDLSTTQLTHLKHPLLKGEEIFLFQKLNYFIFLSRKSIPPKLFGKSKTVSNQIEIPLAGVSWIVDTIENKFIKPPHKGGLPNNIRLYKECIGGEELQISCLDTTQKDTPKGYMLSNFSRNSHSPKSTIQEFQMPDILLFEKGLMNSLKHFRNMLKADDGR